MSDEIWDVNAWLLCCVDIFHVQLSVGIKQATFLCHDTSGEVLNSMCLPGLLMSGYILFILLLKA